MNTEAQNYEVRSISKNKAKQNFKSENIRLIIVTLLSIALYEADRKWTEKKCLEYLRHPNKKIQDAAVMSIAHIARLDRRLCKNVIPIFKKYLKDPQLSGRVQDAMDDIFTFTDIDESMFFS